MSNYVKSTNFTTKDTLPSGNSNKIVKGTELDTEFTAIASAIASKADLNSPALTGTPTAPTAASGTNTTQLATTAFVTAERSASITLTNKTITSPTISDPTITGVPTAPTASPGTNTTQLATTAFVTAAITSGTGALGLGTIATQNANNVAITGGTITGLSSPLPTASGGTGTTSTTGTGSNVFSASPALTGTPTAPTASFGTNTTQLATTAFVTAAIPAGIITMWSGSVASIPSGWVLCNGSNGTPDLRNRFIVGAGSTYAVAATGGSADAIVVSHTHTASTNTTGAHTHSYEAVGNFDGAQTLQNGSTPIGGTRQTASAGDHSHTVTVNSAGSSGTNANLPPYYALAFIMKT
jgi:hypothetical protein